MSELIHHVSEELGDFYYNPDEFRIEGSSLRYIGSETDGKKITIPEGVKACGGMFNDCTSLKIAPIISESMDLYSEVKKIIYDKYGCVSKHIHGDLDYEMYADYNDVMDNKTACKILNSDDPSEALDFTLDLWYENARVDYEQELLNEIIHQLAEEGIVVAEDDIVDIMNDCIYFSCPREHFLNQEFEVNILVDTGDGNKDYTLNSVYPCWYGNPEDYHDDKSSIVWLAKQQGYGKREFRNAMNKGDLSNPHGFLDSMRVELANLSSHMSTLTFLVKMSLKNLIELNKLIRLQEKNGHYYDHSKIPYCGYIILDKTTTTGLYDPWGGGGSCFEVELEKDVKLPVKFIRSALPDGGDGYSIYEVYAMCTSAWGENSIKQIHKPTTVK